MRRYGAILSAALAVCLLRTICFADPQSRSQAKGQAAKGVPTWTEIKAQIESQWKTTYPQEKILTIEKKGEPEFTEEAGKTETTWNWDWYGGSGTTIKGREGSYCRQTVLVTIERANRTRARFTVAALYKYTGNRWQFAEMPTGPVEELPGADSPASPPNEEAAKIFTEAWKKVRPDFDVSLVEVLGKPEFHQSKGRYWLTYKLAVGVTGTRKGTREGYGKKFKCTPADYSSVLKWDPGNKLWAADEGMIQNINESGVCEAVD